MARNDSTEWLILAGVAVAGYVLYQNGTLGNLLPSIFGSGSASSPIPSGAPVVRTTGTSTTTGGGGSPTPTPSAPPPVPNSPAQVLTVADAAVYPYSAAVTAAQMNSIHDSLVSELQGGQIPQIAGNSVLAFMLGWGGAQAGQVQTVLGDTYAFDGSNWNLTSGATVQSYGGMVGLGIPARMIHRSNGYRIRRAA